MAQLIKLDIKQRVLSYFVLNTITSVCILAITLVAVISFSHKTQI